MYQLLFATSADYSALSPQQALNLVKGLYGDYWLMKSLENLAFKRVIAAVFIVFPPLIFTFKLKGDILYKQSPFGLYCRAVSLQFLRLPDAPFILF